MPTFLVPQRSGARLQCLPACLVVILGVWQEPNHHKTYVLLVDALGSRELAKIVLSTTYYYCR